MNFLETKDVVKQYANHLALDGVSIQVKKGEVFGLLGPNGAGKTTLIRIINRITAPDQGEVLLDGKPLAPNDVFRIGYLPEERGLYKKMKVGEQAIYLAELKGVNHKVAKERLTSWFEKFDIMPWWNKKVEELSKGMQQKIQFVTTVIHEPDLMIFDEPFSGFDPVNAELLKREILALRDQGKTIIFSTHNMHSVEEVCDNIALINNSRVVLSGEVNEIRSAHHTNIYQIEYSGDNIQQMPGIFTIESEEPSIRNHHVIRVRKENGVSNTNLLESLLANREIYRFEEEIPSMNDIFIKTVQTKKTTNNHE